MVLMWILYFALQAIVSKITPKIFLGWRMVNGLFSFWPRHTSEIWCFVSCIETETGIHNLVFSLCFVVRKGDQDSVKLGSCWCVEDFCEVDELVIIYYDSVSS